MIDYDLEIEIKCQNDISIFEILIKDLYNSIFNKTKY
jgi:hypothetical protein